MYVSVDLETTSLDPDDGQILQVGLVIDDLKRPIDKLARLEFLVYPIDGIVGGTLMAISMNAKLLAALAAAEKDDNFSDRVYHAGEVADTIADFLDENGLKDQKVVFAGKNAANFDLPFLRNYGLAEKIQIHHRVIDVGSMYFQPQVGNCVPPSLKGCLDIAGLPSVVEHTALSDALQVVRLVRAKVRNWHGD